MGGMAREKQGHVDADDSGFVWSRKLLFFIFPNFVRLGSLGVWGDGTGLASAKAVFWGARLRVRLRLGAPTGGCFWSTTGCDVACSKGVQQRQQSPGPCP